VYPPKPVRESQTGPTLQVIAGEHVTIRQESGQWNCAPAGPWGPAETGPSGIEGANDQGDQAKFLAPNQPLCSLVAKIGEEPDSHPSQDWREVGLRPDFIADRSGVLFLTANEIPPNGLCPYYDEHHQQRCFSDNVDLGLTVTVTVTAAG
jgi:hypothetical protein